MTRAMPYFHYFAYGSNMSSRRLVARLGAATRIGPAVLDDHSLVFHKVGFRDRSGKCGIVASTGCVVHGLLLRLTEQERTRLDRIEGVGYGYEAATLRVRQPHGAVVMAHTYVPTHLDPSLRPFHWYRHHVLVGARESGLPDNYIESIMSVSTVQDDDTARRERELSIYRDIPA